MTNYTIEVPSGSPRNWKNISYQRSLSPDPQKFSAIIEYNAAIDYFNTVNIKQGGTTEFFGYVEGLKPFWDENGRYLKIWGRCRKVILWKKMTERFSDGRLEGFFGKVDPAKLIYFLLRCPISDAPTASNLSKIGWGLDANDWDVSAIRTASSRHEDWVKNRMIGLAWQLGPLYEGHCEDMGAFTSITNEWDNNGTAGDLGDDDYATYRQAYFYSFLTADAAAGQPVIVVASATGFTAGMTVRVTNQAATGMHGGNHETKTIQGIVGGTITFTANLVNPYTVANNSGMHKTSLITDEYWNVDDLGHTSGTITAAHIDVYGRHVINSWGASPEADANVKIYIYDGSSWTDAGNISWAEGEEGHGLGWPNVLKTKDISAIIDTFAKANACRVRLVQIVTDATQAMPRISEMNLRVTGYSYQTNGDWLEIDLGAAKNRVTGIYIESRKSANVYARNYKIQTSNTGAWGGEETDQVTVANNTCRDIIESWVAADNVRYIRILLTSGVAFAWEISQIYVYCADNHKYCVLDEGSGDSLGPYLGTVTIGDYVTAEDVITPINLPFGRLNDNIDEVVQKCHDGSYNLWEWWVDHDDGEFHFAARKGSDLHATIDFIKGKHIESVGREGESRAVTSRVRVIGKGEGKKQDEISSDWQVNVAGEGVINSFYEGIVTAKRVADKATADIMANVEVKQKGTVDLIYEIQISNDTHAAMAYDIGDDVTVTDSLTAMSGTYRIYTIRKKITKNGEDLLIYVGSTYKDVSDNWAEVRKLLREISATGTAVEDWFAEGIEQTKLDADKITNMWEKTAANVDDQDAPADENDGSWVISLGGIAAQALDADEGVFQLKGSKVADAAQKNLTAYVKNTESTTPNIAFSKNPRFKVDFKILVEGTDPAASTEWNDGDILYLTFGKSGFTRYFGFFILRRNGAYELWSEIKDSGGNTFVRATETAAGTVINLQDNTKYRLEAEVIWDAKIVRFTFNTELLAILPFNAAPAASTLFPLSLKFTTSNPAGALVYWAHCYIYKWKSEWDWVA